ncbi:transposase [Stieleria tagensis]|uniref:transposase n=1 Tax=Stieleria tagensis TaxID=2956795 RepID=UPI0028F414C9|nr:transposase [Stieleria tagensis]
MPRTKRPDEAGKIYHVVNRGNNRQEIFHKAEDYEAFLRTLAEGLGKYPVDLFAFCLLPNHWHLVLRPRKDGSMGRLGGWLASTHTLLLPRAQPDAWARSPVSGTFQELSRSRRCPLFDRLPLRGTQCPACQAR